MSPMVKRKVNRSWDLVLPAKKRNKTEQVFVEYVESLSGPSEVSAKDYAMYVKANAPAVRHRFIVSTWEKLRSLISASNRHDMEKIKEAFKDVSTITIPRIAGWINTARVREVSSTLPILPNTAGSSPTSSESSSSTLSTDAITAMNTLYSKNFEDFKGDPWDLSTGTNIDNILYRQLKDNSRTFGVKAGRLGKTEERNKARDIYTKARQEFVMDYICQSPGCI
ncbi:hypothetical protein BGZ46_008574 [Entomortierella lignicola]|nr:hypothetical protein BGZ46_008574 [Entomortierella lignicola]